MILTDLIHISLEQVLLKDNTTLTYMAGCQQTGGWRMHVTNKETAKQSSNEISKTVMAY